MRLGIDVDGVLRDFVGSLIIQYSKDYPDHEVKPVTEWDLHNFFPLGKGIYDYAFKERAREVFENATPYPDTLEHVEKLKEAGHEIFILTTQPRGKEVHTLNWLLKHDVPYDGIVFTGHKGVVDCDVFLDDGVHNLNAIQSSRKTAVCFDRPWNKRWVWSRVASIKEFYLFVETFQRDMELCGEYKKRIYHDHP